MVKIRALTLEMRTADKIISEFAFCVIAWLVGWLVGVLKLGFLLVE